MAGSPMYSGGDEVLTYYSKWNVGADGAMTKDANVPGRGFTGVTRTAAGKNRIDFARGVVGELVDLDVRVWSAADAEGPRARPTDAGYTAATSSAVGTALYEVWDIDETAAQVDPANGDTVSIKAVFLKTR